MNIFIDNKSSSPIYEQIFTQIKTHIITGILQEDEPLPSIRNLAKDLRISVITTKRAYDELEHSGFIYTIAGKGCFVAHKNSELIKEENLKSIEEHIQEIAQLAKISKLSKNDIIQMFNLIFEED
ncbi:MAG: GntR family transcriptional regulator [Acutalibacteraceae bacterium]|nr:GntR family transcriptional regulator [Acutalibacteraceae bacterium]